jgi:hypothetical protein
MPNRSSADINEVNNWNHWFELDGERMKPGVLNVLATFPDGTSKDVQLEVVEGSRVIEDHGNPGTYADDKIFLRLQIHGATVEQQWNSHSTIKFVWYDANKPILPKDIPKLRHKLELADKICLAIDNVIMEGATNRALTELKQVVDEYRRAP